MTVSVKGRVGSHELEFLSAPRGPVGETRVRVGGGEPFALRWRRDAEGLWIELPDGLHGFDLRASADDSGAVEYAVSRRLREGEWAGLRFERPGDAALAAAAGAGTRAKGARVRAQMPGKIVRVLVKEGDEVAKDQPLLVMEAMKMENEIRAPRAGRVAAVRVGEGQAVESGAPLVELA